MSSDNGGDCGLPAQVGTFFRRRFDFREAIDVSCLVCHCKSRVFRALRDQLITTLYLVANALLLRFVVNLK